MTPIQYNSSIPSVALITVSLDHKVADQIAEVASRMLWAIHRADCEGYISAVKRPPFPQPVKSASCCVAVIDFDKDIEQAITAAGYVQDMFGGRVALIALSASHDPRHSSACDARGLH